ncbi:hypothetical protein PQE20_03590 [Vibrio harveyi]|uniref:hypothetical protein n=1 Tax=Vibrio harveyi TaxID=669 RepID=UPI00234D031C|nr:hypothetical protein [Vibrio harveyi]WCP81102.1 hypothetical protein PQE20_03590 [Vibrio harveyi]
MPDVSNDTNTESLTNSISEKVAEKSTLLNDFDTFYAAWKNKGLTDLQRDHFEKSFVGQKVFWDVKINSISEESDGYLWCSVGSVNKELSIEHAIAVFEPKYKEALLMVNTGEVVKYTGTIDSFSLSPVIKNSGISKH